MADQARDIGRFRNATLIGQGGFGSVYRATDAEHGRDVAIKVLQGILGDTERRRFDRERQTMGRLGAHPNIMPVHESGYTAQGEGYLVMELAPHGSLAQRLQREGPLPWPEAVAVMVDIARATQAAHDQGVLHRDIKPDNILIDAYRNPRLTDFGIAAVASNATATTSTTATIAHAAPEVLEGWPPTPAIDIYALGSTFYNLVLGRPPFQEPGDHGVSAMIARTMTALPPDLRPFGVPDRVATVAERALAKDSAARQPSAAHLADELAAAAASAGGGSGAGPGAGVGAGAATIVADGPLSGPITSLPSIPSTTDPSAPTQISTPHSSVPGTGPSAAPPTLVGPGVGPSAIPYPNMAGTGSDNWGPGPGQWAGGQPAPGNPWGGGHTPVDPYASAGPGGGDGPGNRSGRLLLLVAGVVLAAVVGVAGTLLIVQRTGDGDTTAAGDGDGATTTDPGATTTDPSATTTDPGASPESSGVTGAGSASSSATATTATATPTTASTTSSSTTSTTSTTTTGPPPSGPCELTVVATRSATFDVAICGDGFGGLTYVGAKRSTGDGIELPACDAGGDVFFATNEGFTYVVDAFQGRLIVGDPDGDLVVDESLQGPVTIDRSIPADAC
ncbi:MAG: serine/threonine-protein kinase [Acidimicrobiales bacterium]